MLRGRILKQKELLKFLSTNSTLFDSCKKDVSLEIMLQTVLSIHQSQTWFENMFLKVTVIVYDISMIIAIIKDNQRCVKRKKETTKRKTGK